MLYSVALTGMDRARLYTNLGWGRGEGGREGGRGGMEGGREEGDD